ncbi:hypothetical protein [Rhodopseudomonas pseudopalustris]|uniref:Uncharacterized protein n=2 Tax=Rhodopseudomonas TaxID=1073 RepID=Q13B62_RHOPS|nr:hypothetical protein [Rhodopseudomonas pseudopalustris]ABE38677.1 hypothetical protein RPD_1440 [Rhodopseudomonas palustris BisB5]SEO38331.1 hypothetical protein SAMN05444123_102451 [Rhodopseudomonas pseudopalustris]
MRGTQVVANYHVAVGDQNALGQYLVDRTVSPDKRPHLRIGCIHCGNEYLATDVSFHNCKCPSCQDGENNRPISRDLI